MSAYQPRYVAYATAHGRTPEEQGRHDDQAWPGGRNTGFLIWMSEKWSQWRLINRRHRDDPLSAEDHASFDAMIGVTK